MPATLDEDWNARREAFGPELLEHIDKGGLNTA
jgi:hypothetical protein